MKMPLYHMVIVFSIDTSEKTLKQFLETMGEAYPVLENAVQMRIEQTVPFVPTKEILQKYADTIQETYKSGSITAEHVAFSHYDVFEQVESDIEIMGYDRAKQIAFCCLQLMRQTAEQSGKDPHDYDDQLFSELDIEVQELEELYAPYGVSVYGGSYFETGQSPKNYDKVFFSK